MKVLIYSDKPYEGKYLQAIKNHGQELHFTPESLNESTVHLAEGFEAVSLFSSDKANAVILQKLSDMGVRFIALRSAGYDHVDLAKAKELGLKVANVPDYSPYAIAEHAVAILLAFNRKICLSQKLMKENDFRLEQLVGFDLHGKTVGVIGTGKIGFAFAKIMNGFGCKVLAVDPTQNPEAKSINLEYTSLENLLQSSDIISLSCPLNEHTQKMIGWKEFEMMKKGAILINTARGGVIETSALIHYLQNDHLGGACLDVYEKEKGIFFNDLREEEINDNEFQYLMNSDKVLMTGHQGFLTEQALIGRAKTTILNLKQWDQFDFCENDLYAEKSTLETA